MAPRKLVWLITGCSTGLGYDLAIEALSRGDRVIATARNGQVRLEDLKRKGASLLDLDVTWSQEKIEAVMEEAVGLHEGGVDVLVNNAGYVQLGLVEEMTLAELQNSIDCLTFGPIKTMRALAPHWRAKNSGTNVSISSLMGFTGNAASAAYCAAKFAMEGAFESAAQELAPFGIETIIFEPGWLRTAMAVPGNIKLCHGDISDYAKTREYVNGFATYINGNQAGDPKKAAKRIVDLVRREGIAEGKTSIPLRLPTGPDAFEAVRKKCTDTLKDLEEWEKALADTNLDS